MKTLAFLFLLAFTSCKKDWIDYSPIDMYSATIGYEDNDAPKHLNVAAVSISPSKINKQETLNTIKYMVENIKYEHNDIQVIVFGELILEWYYDSQNKDLYQLQMAEKISGTSVSFIKDLAISNNVNIVFGFTEIDSVSSKLYNSQVLIHSNGEIETYRKRNLNQTDLDNNISAGNELVISEIEGVRAALFVCSDMQSNKITKELADSKVDVVFHSLTSTTDLNSEISYLGLQLNTWIVFANRFGKEDDVNYTGFSQIINPVGTICERIVGEGYVYRRIGIFNK